MTSLKRFGYWCTLLLAVLLVGGCQEAAPPDDPSSHVQGSSASVTTEEVAVVSSASDSVSSEDTTEGSTSQGEASESISEPSDNGEQLKDGDSNPSNQSGKLQVHYIDVGQGAAQLLIGPSGKTMLIDAGDNDKEQFIVEYLQNQGITTIDILIGTHPHADHIGGLDAVIQQFEIGQLYMPRFQANTRTFEDVLRAVQDKGLKINTAKSGVELDWEAGIDAKIVAPIRNYDDANEMSAVVHVKYGDTAFIFTGDAESQSEGDMVKSDYDLTADVLHVGHHGSNTSTSPEFLKRVNPAYAVIQSGADNMYGHPHREVLQRLKDYGVDVYRNDEQGHIIFTSDGQELAIRSVNQDQVSRQDSSQKPEKTTAERGDEQSQTSHPQEPVNAQVSKELAVEAMIDNPTPKQNSTLQVTVIVKDSLGQAVQGADIQLKLHYKSTTTDYEGKTDADGKATLSFRIGRAAKNFTVNGDIAVQFGEQKGKAQVSFTPQ